MVFNSPFFLFIFLPLLCLVYFSAKLSYRKGILLGASLLFYGWADWWFLVVLLAICMVSYFLARAIEACRNHRLRVACLAAGILADVLALGYYKYLPCFCLFANSVWHTSFVLREIIMPLGLSFYVFSSISYIVDVYRREVNAEHHFMKLLFFIVFFPKLLEGPIVQYHDFISPINQYQENFHENILFCAHKFIIGLGKKVILADSLGSVADQIFAVGYTGVDIGIAWLGAIAFSLQLYFDFSGYSDMAIALGRLFGFRIFENFNYPYISQSITEFWRRWHISLGQWFKNYLYIPLGGNRCGGYRTYFNLAVVFLVTGVWHGAGATFIIWGMLHGICMIFERKLKIDRQPVGHSLFKHVYTVMVLVFGWVLFRADSLAQGWGFIAAMTGFGQAVFVPFSLEYYLSTKVIILLLAAILGCTPVMNHVLMELPQQVFRHGRIITGAYMLIILVLAVSYIALAVYQPFIYFKF